jgi:hypothetical protein
MDKKGQKFKVLEFRQNQRHCVVLFVSIPTVYSFLKMDSVCERYRNLKFFPNRQKNSKSKSTVCTTDINSMSS